MLSAIPEEGASWCSSCCSGCALCYKDWLQKKRWTLFSIFTFFIKAVSIFRFLSVSENSYCYRSFVKMKWSKANFQKVGDTCILFLTASFSSSMWSSSHELHPLPRQMIHSKLCQTLGHFHALTLGIFIVCLSMPWFHAWCPHHIHLSLQVFLPSEMALSS